MKTPSFQVEGTYLGVLDLPLMLFQSVNAADSAFRIHPESDPLLVQATITSSLDYCSSLLSLPAYAVGPFMLFSTWQLQKSCSNISGTMSILCSTKNVPTEDPCICPFHLLSQIPM